MLILPCRHAILMPLMLSPTTAHADATPFSPAFATARRHFSPPFSAYFRFAAAFRYFDIAYFRCSPLFSPAIAFAAAFATMRFSPAPDFCRAMIFHGCLPPRHRHDTPACRHADILRHTPLIFIAAAFSC
jgi:hypothetical protein